MKSIRCNFCHIYSVFSRHVTLYTVFLHCRYTSSWFNTLVITILVLIIWFNARFILSSFLGTGKTTTLLHFALSHPNHKFLYLVYNKSVQVLASKLFPKSNVVCKTLHSLAFGHTGWAKYTWFAAFWNSIAPKFCEERIIIWDQIYHVNCKIIMWIITKFLPWTFCCKFRNYLALQKFGAVTRNVSEY